jgi:hypothetical protein
LPSSPGSRPAIILVSLVFAADAPEWPRFRGPLGNPISAARLPDTWSKTQNVNEEGKTFVIAAGEKYELLKVNDLEEFALATPALIGERLLLRTESLLYSIRQKRYRGTQLH